MPAHKKKNKAHKGKSKSRKARGGLAASAFLGTKTLTVVPKESFIAVAWLDLDAGTYLVSASGTVNRLSNNVGSDLLVQARLTAGAATMPFMYFHGPTASPASSADVELAGRVDLTKKGRITVECGHFDFADTVVEAIEFELFAQEVTIQDND